MYDHTGFFAFNFVLQRQFRKSVECWKYSGLERLDYLIKQEKTYLITFSH